jgi:3-methyladenine DNA glycosylase AlkD
MKIADVLKQLDADQAGKKRLMMGPLRALGKKLKKDHSLGIELWATGRTDARVLATMIMEPGRLTAREAEEMLGALTDSQLVDELTRNVIADASCADDLARKWSGSDHELTGRAGWSLLASKITQKRMDSAECGGILETIEERRKTAPVKTAETMMRCLVEIGVRFPEHRPRATDIGTRWGRIDDRPVAKGCTPFHAVEWMEALLRRQK